jgi:hypothetical protein
MRPTLHLHLDDSGTRYPNRRAPFRRDGLDYFAIGGLLIKSEDVEGAVEKHRALTTKYALTKPLHSNSLRSKKGEFRRILENPERARDFYNDLTEMLCTLPAYITGCVVHRPGYNERYARIYGDARWDLCKSAYTIVVERATKLAHRYDRKLMVYVERTGKKEDRAIRVYHADLRNSGMYFNAETSAKYGPLDAPDFRNRLFAEPKFVLKAHVLAQLSDLVLYPLAKGRYDPAYAPYRRLVESGRLVDSILSGKDIPTLGVKYYCFDGV